jgi:hypothetical protein
MRTITWMAAALAVAFTTSCKDRDRGDDTSAAADSIQAAGEQASGEIREGAAKTEDAVEDAADKTKDAANDAADKTKDAANDAADKTKDAADDAADKTKDAANDAADKTKDAANDGAGTVEKTADALGISSYSYERRDAFREDVDKRLAEMDKDLAEARKSVNQNSAEAYTKGVAAAEETRKAVGHDVDKLAGATEATWDQIQKDVSTSLASLDRELRALRTDANPMGGAGPN